MEQLCRPGRGLVNLLLLVMRVTLQLHSWVEGRRHQNCCWRSFPAFLLPLTSAMMPPTHHPSTGGVQSLAEPCHENKWVRAVRNQAVFCISFAVYSQEWAGGMRLLLEVAMVCAWLTGHDIVVLHAGRVWFLKPINKTHLWTGFSNSRSCRVSLWKCISRL